MEVTLTTFLDYLVATTPNSRLAVVREAKQQYVQGYDPAHDYYLPLRHAIVAMHRANAAGATLDSVVNRVSARKATNYQQCVGGYKGWMRRKTIKWRSRPTAIPWTSGGLRVMVNPEYALTVDGQREVTKLYFKSDRLSAARSGAGLYLLDQAFGPRAGLLDVRRGKRFGVPASQPSGIEIIVNAEAGAFAQIWRKLP